MCLLIVKVGVQKILGSIDQLRTRVDGKDQDIQFLSDLLANTQLQSLIKVDIQDDLQTTASLYLHVTI